MVNNKFGDCFEKSTFNDETIAIHYTGFDDDSRKENAARSPSEPRPVSRLSLIFERFMV